MMKPVGTRAADRTHWPTSGQAASSGPPSQPVGVCIGAVPEGAFGAEPEPHVSPSTNGTAGSPSITIALGLCYLLCTDLGRYLFSLSVLRTCFPDTYLLPPTRTPTGRWPAGINQPGGRRDAFPNSLPAPAAPRQSRSKGVEFHLGQTLSGHRDVPAFV